MAGFQVATTGRFWVAAGGIPRYRYEVLNRGVAAYLLIKLAEVRKYHPEIEFIERNVQSDHVHIVVSFPPKYSIASVVQLLKQNTGRELRRKFEFIHKRYYGRGGMWSVGYFASTVGLDEDTIRHYVRYQEKEDLGQTKFAFPRFPVPRT